MLMTKVAPTSWIRRVDFTPGSYLKARRTAQLLELQDVAQRIGTKPHIPERARIGWLQAIEGDVIPASFHTIETLKGAYRFDLTVLASLAAIARGERDPAFAPRICRICACSWRSPCTHGDEACGWVDGEDLCTACATPGQAQ